MGKSMDDTLPRDWQASQPAPFMTSRTRRHLHEHENTIMTTLSNNDEHAEHNQRLNTDSFEAT